MTSTTGEARGGDDTVTSVTSPTRGVMAIVVPMGLGTLLSAVLIVGIYAGRSAGDRPALGGPTEPVRDVPSHVRGFAVDVETGHALYMGTCSSCHGAGGEGMPMQGANLQRSDFVASRSNEQLLTFLILGRQPGDRFSVLGRAMPPRGGNSELDDADLADIVGYLRRMQVESKAPPRLPTVAAAAAARR